MSVKVESLYKKFNSQIAVNHISFDSHKGKITGLIGPNGAGKTTVMRMICGLLNPDGGKIWINNTLLDEDPVKLKRHIGYLPENNPLYPEMYVQEYLGFSLGIYEKKYSRDKINEVIKLTGLIPEKNKKIGQLSKGYRQRVGIARALIHNPDILILDEPTTGLDPNQIIEIRNLISEVGKEKTVILSTHIMQEVEAICDKVILLDQGKILADSSPDILKQSLNQNQVIVVEFDKSISENILLSIMGVEKIKKVSEYSWIVENSSQEDIRPKIFNIAVKNNLTVLSMREKSSKLEDVFHELTSSKNHGRHS